MSVSKSPKMETVMTVKHNNPHAFFISILQK